MRHTLISALTLVTLAACNDSGDPTRTYINARIDGTYWSGPASEGQVVYTVEGPAGPGIIVSIASIRVGSGSQVLSLGLVNPPALGTAALDGAAGRGSWNSCPNNILADCASWSAIPSDPGTLTITKIDPGTGLIEGTFSFTAYLLGNSTAAKKSITEGQFAILAPSVFNRE